jgi:hypothetical protein
MTMPWQIQRDIARTKTDDAMRAAKFAHHHASLRRRRTRRMASILLQVSDWLERTVPRGEHYRSGRTVGSPGADAQRPDVRLTVSPLDVVAAGSKPAG